MQIVLVCRIYNNFVQCHWKPVCIASNGGLHRIPVNPYPNQSVPVNPYHRFG